MCRLLWLTSVGACQCLKIETTRNVCSQNSLKLTVEYNIAFSIKCSLYFPLLKNWDNIWRLSKWNWRGREDAINLMVFNFKLYCTYWLNVFIFSVSYKLSWNSWLLFELEFIFKWLLFDIWFPFRTLSITYCLFNRLRS